MDVFHTRNNNSASIINTHTRVYIREREFTIDIPRWWSESLGYCIMTFIGCQSVIQKPIPTLSDVLYIYKLFTYNVLLLLFYFFTF